MDGLDAVVERLNKLTETVNALVSRVHGIKTTSILSEDLEAGVGWQIIEEEESEAK